MEAGLESSCNVTLHEMDEGKENHLFKQALGNDRNMYDSSIDGKIYLKVIEKSMGASVGRFVSINYTLPFFGEV